MRRPDRHARACGLVAGVSGSCGAPIEVWWRASKQLGRRDPLDHMHRSTAKGTHRKRLWSIDWRWLGEWLCFTLKKSEAEREQPGSLPVSEEAEVADTNEAAWQQVQQETAQELIDGQVHDALLVGVGGVRQRKLTMPSEKATSLLLAMRTRWV
jgi:hypothetical protein